MSQPLDYETPPDLRPPLPLGVVIGAWVFIAFGILSAADIVWGAFHDRVSINFGILGIFIGRGLLRRSGSWVGVAMIALWLDMIGSVVIVLTILFGAFAIRDSASGRIIPRRIVEATTIVAICVALFIYGHWQYRLLTSPAVRRLYDKRTGGT
jgi:hypothetical protein